MVSKNCLTFAAENKKKQDMKKYFNTRKEANKVCEERNKRLNVNQVRKKTWGRHKGMFFVGSDIEWLNLNY